MNLSGLLFQLEYQLGGVLHHLIHLQRVKVPRGCWFGGGGFRPLPFCQCLYEGLASLVQLDCKYRHAMCADQDAMGIVGGCRQSACRCYLVMEVV